MALNLGNFAVCPHQMQDGGGAPAKFRHSALVDAPRYPKRISRMTGIDGLPWASTDSRNGR